ncbi:AGAP005378-PC-like protein [Anopheles sinensis]|uniref:AGAP005378-PC-like protein n=1 Tax=Anopheles sinensis TaxID=74873 RepID=A0A084WEV4_ANOSI|nr:AGAP005378-PC-like protein [Anopheles sinensis]
MVLLFFAPPLTDLRTAFDLLDRDQDGHVTPEELQFMLRNLGIHVRDELIDDLLREASRTGSGLIDETEFLQWVARIQALKDDSNTSSSSSSSNNPAQSADDDLTQDLVAAFRVFDRDGNGYITRDELKSAMDMIGENVTEYQLNEMLELADADKDGRINYEALHRAPSRAPGGDGLIIRHLRIRVESLFRPLNCVSPVNVFIIASGPPINQSPAEDKPMASQEARLQRNLRVMVPSFYSQIFRLEITTFSVALRHLV